MNKQNITKGIALVSAAVGLTALGIKKIEGVIGSIQEEMPDLPEAELVYRDKLKRYIDLMNAIPVTILAAIPMLIVAISIKLDSPGPVIFKQDRIGKDGEVFQMWKFRSMCVNAEHTGSGVYSGKDDSRVTRVGKLIRAASIDELPQLFNVIKGDMSLIGDSGIIGTTKKNLDFARVSAA